MSTTGIEASRRTDSAGTVLEQPWSSHGAAQTGAIVRQIK
ncbi:hypothetical protein J2Z45_002925 [Cohnella lubricantis]|nr:hypothetical protein [Cohnella lubricantis]